MHTRGSAAAFGCLAIAHAVLLAAWTQDPQAGTAKGTLTVGATKVVLAHAFAAAEKDESGAETYHVLVTDKPFPAGEVADASDRQAVALLFAEQEIHGLELFVAADQHVIRANVYSPEAAMGMRLLSAPTFQATVFDARTIAGRIATPSPVQDARLNATVGFDATFTAAVRRAPAWAWRTTGKTLDGPVDPR